MVEAAVEDGREDEERQQLRRETPLSASAPASPHVSPGRAGAGRRAGTLSALGQAPFFRALEVPLRRAQREGPSGVPSVNHAAPGAGHSGEWGSLAPRDS